MARYFFSQLWTEFTIEVLSDFNKEDALYRKDMEEQFAAELKRRKEEEEEINS